MAFYTDKWIVLEKDEKDLMLFRKINKDITMEKIVGEVDKNDKECLCEDTFKEFDIEIDKKGNIYLLYQNDEMHLILKVFKEDKWETIKLTDKPIAEIIHLNIAIIDEKINILYAIATIEKNNYKIYHHYYYSNRWNTFMIEELNAEKILNPIKVLKTEKNLVVSYIKGKDIFIKTFQFNNLKWSEKIKLTNTENEKIFLDIINVDDIYHTSYCEFIDDRLVVKYKKISLKDMSNMIIQENTLSKKGSPSYPTVISYKGQIWVVWLELNKVYSRMLNEGGDGFGPIYLWKESINKDIVRYRYKRKDKNNDVILDYSFGKVYPEVQFLGFGPTNKAKQISTESDENVLKNTLNEAIKYKQNKYR